MRLLAGTGASLVVVLASTLAHAVEDDLPVANEPPRIVPVLVADAYYAYHDPRPATRAATLLTSASRHNEFAINMLAIGARVEHAKLTGAAIVHFGTAIDALYANPDNPLSGSREVWKHIQQANVGWKTGDFHFEAGVMPSLLGRESFVSTENWNYSRAIIADSTPYYVTGLRATWRMAPTLSLSGTAFNGWDHLSDRNSHKSGMLRLSWNPSEKLSIANAVVAGWEQDLIKDEKRPFRVFDDLVIAYQLHKRIALALEGWIGTEQNYSIEDPRKGNIANKHVLKNPSFYGGALWAKWQFGDTTYVALRGEGLNDPAGVITGRGGREKDELIIGQKLLAGTVTLGWQPHPRMLARVEAMHRTSSERFFTGGDKLAYEETPAASGTPSVFRSDARKSSTTLVISAAFSY